MKGSLKPFLPRQIPFSVLVAMEISARRIDFNVSRAGHDNNVTHSTVVRFTERYVQGAPVTVDRAARMNKIVPLFRNDTVGNDSCPISKGCRFDAVDDIARA
jgi:hypothetical protein